MSIKIQNREWLSKMTHSKTAAYTHEISKENHSGRMNKVIQKFRLKGSIHYLLFQKYSYIS